MSPLAIETGRHARQKVPVDQRLCKGGFTLHDIVMHSSSYISNNAVLIPLRMNHKKHVFYSSRLSHEVLANQS